MTTQRERTEQQTAIRRKLLANGYTPLANDDKRCMLKHWPQIEVTPALIEEWADKLRYQATGVRLDGALTVIDIDIDDADIIDEIIERLPDELWDRVGAAPERRGKGAKLAWFVRCNDPFQRFASMAFARPDEDPEGEGVDLHRVEVFGPKAVRQFGAYGAHTMVRGQATVEYRWADKGLTDVPLDALPLLALDEIDLICRIANEVLQEEGWVRHMRSKSGKGSSGVVYDLTDEMEFKTRDHGTVSLAELEELARGETGIRLSASWLEGAGARNKTRCIAGVDHDSNLQIYETASGDLHKREIARPKLAGTDALAALSKYAGGSLFGGGAAGGTSASGGEGGGDAEGGEGDLRELVGEVVDYLLQHFAFCPTEDKPVYPLAGGAPRTMANFREEFNWASIEVTGPRGGVKRVHPVDFWRTEQDRVQIIGERFNPRKRDHLIEVDEGLALNLYRPVDHARAADGAALKVWHAFLEHLFPHEDERAWFRMWLAAKAQRPWLPNCAVLMFTEVQGTGRGTLFDILRGVFGDRHCATVTSLELLGEGGQSQYTEWLAGSLVAFCEELMSGEELGVNQAWRRKQSYERLKVLFEPRPRRASIIRKGRPNYDDWVHTSFLLASNNPNALPIPLEDRRLAVLRNTSEKLEHASVGALVDEMRDAGGQGFRAAFLAAVWHDLQSVEVEWAEVFNAPPWLEGRADMISANESEIDHLIEDVMSRVPGDFILQEHLKDRLAKAAEAAGMVDEPWWREARQTLAKRNKSGWRVLRHGTRQNVQPKEPVAKRAVVYFRVNGAGEASWESTPLEDRPDLWRRGSDLNDKLTRAGEALRDGRFGVVKSDGGDIK